MEGLRYQSFDEWRRQRLIAVSDSRRTCHRKVGYFSREDAQRALVAMREKNRLLYYGEPYRCDHCDSWHLGHRPAPQPVIVPDIDLPLGLTVLKFLRAILKGPVKD